MRVFSIVALFALLLSTGVVFAETPNEITYQGRLREYDQPVSGTRTMCFKIFDAANGGNQCWTSGNVSVIVSTGVLSYGMTPDSVDWRGKDYWIETAISNKILSPREKITSQVFAFHSRTSEDIEKSQVKAYILPSAQVRRYSLTATGK